MSNDNALEPTAVQTGAESAAAAPVPADSSDATPAAPAESTPSFGGLLFGILNFVTLTARFMALAAAAVWLKENLHLLKAHMRRDASFARRIAELSGQAGADDYFVGLFIEASQALDRVAEASGELANTADGMEANARAVQNAHETEYGAVYEAVQASPYQQPKPGFNRVR